MCLELSARFWDHFGSVEIKQTIDRCGERNFAGQSSERACGCSFRPGTPHLLHCRVSLSGSLAEGHLIFYSELPHALETIDAIKLIPFPPFDGSKFAQILDEEMGFR